MPDRSAGPERTLAHRIGVDRIGVDRLTRWIAVLAAFTTLSGIVGWTLRIPALVQPSHVFGPLRPLPLIVIMLASLTVYGLGAARPVLVRIAALLTIGLSMVGVLTVVNGWALGFDAALHARLPEVEPLRPPVGVALWSALIYSAIASSAWASSGQRLLERRARMVRAAGALILTCAVVLWLFQLAGLFDTLSANEWALAPLQSLTAAILLGFAILQHTATDWRQILAPPRWAPALVGMASVGIVLVLWRELRQHEDAQLSTRARIASNATALAVQREFGDARSIISRIALHVTPTGGAASAFGGMVPRLVAETEGLRHVVLVGPDGEVRRIVPTTDVEPLSPQLRKQLRGVLEASRTPRPSSSAADSTVTTREEQQRVVGLTDAPWGVAIIQPVNDGPDQVGAVVGLIDERTLLESFASDTSAGFIIRGFVGDSQVVGDTRPAQVYAHERPLTFGTRTIMLSFSPKRSAMPSTLPDLVFVLGMAIAALLALTLWLARRTFEQASMVGMTRMQRAIERSTDGVWEHDLQTGRVHRSEVLLRYLGLDPDLINGADNAWDARVHPNDVERLHRALEDHVHGRTDAFECEYRIRAHDGHWHTLVDRGRVVERTLDGRPWRLLGISADITERSRADDARLESERRFRAMFETAYQLQLLLDQDGRILEANPAAAELAEVHVAQLQGQRFAALPWWADDVLTQTRVQERITRAFAGETSRFEVPLVASADRQVIVDFSLKPIVDQSGAAIQVLAEGRDITERKRAEKSLREIGALTTMGQLAARVAHEINNPLAGIQNAFLLVREAISTDHPHYRFVGAIEREIARIAAVTRQLYETYRPDQSMESRSSVILAVSDAVSFLEQVNRSRQVRIETDVSGAPSLVPVPDALLRQALYNLVQNALDASPAGGTITVTALQDDGWCVIRVTDEGSGVPEALRSRIFDPFFSTKDRSVKTGGMGIGLSLVRQSVMAVGGQIAVHNRSTGGTEFEIRLPMIPIDTGVLR